MKPKQSDDKQPDRPARDPDINGADAAMQRAAQRARRRAVECGTGAIAVFEDGKVVWMAVDKESLALRRPSGDA